MSFLTLSQVGKSFGGPPVVDQVSLEVPRGEFFSLLGPSGCGKTTLLRMIAGFETPDSGTIAIDGEVMNRVPPHLRLRAPTIRGPRNSRSKIWGRATPIHTNSWPPSSSTPRM